MTSQYSSHISLRDNFFQSQTWIDMISFKGHQSVSVEFNGRAYVGIVKSIMGFSFLQFLGVEFPSSSDPTALFAFLSEFLSIAKKYNCVYVQFGIINSVTGEYDIVAAKSSDNKKDLLAKKTKEVVAGRREYRRILKKVGFFSSFARNVLSATIVYDLHRGPSRATMNTRSARYLKKAQSLNYVIGSFDDLGSDISKEAVSLVRSVLQDKIGSSPEDDYMLHMVKHPNTKIAIVQDPETEEVLGCYIVPCEYGETKTAIFLYGGIKRTKHKGVGQKLMVDTCAYFASLGYDYFDAFGAWSLEGFDDEGVKNVTTFKEGLGGIRIEMPGMFDYPVSIPKYYLILLMHHTKKIISRLVSFVKGLSPFRSKK